MAKLRFLHIPKTAGTTFAGILIRQYGRRRHFQFSGDGVSDRKGYHALSSRRQKGVDLFVGHAPIRSGISAADDAPTITLLRDPVSRVKSFCQHVSEGKSAYLRDAFPPSSFDLDRFLASGNLELENLQTKMLINEQSCDSPSLIATMSPSEAAEAALANLFGRIASYGVQEFFDESLVIFKQKFGWRQPVYVAANRPNPARLITFEEHQIKRIEELNAIDLQVFQSAREAFIERMESAAFDRSELTWLQTQRLAHFPLRAQRFAREATDRALRRIRLER